MLIPNINQWVVTINLLFCLPVFFSRPHCFLYSAFSIVSNKVILDSLLFYSSMLLDTYSYLSSSCPLWCILNSSHCCILCICYLFPFISIFFFHFPPFISITSVPYRTQLVGHSFFVCFPHQDSMANFFQLQILSFSEQFGLNHLITLSH